MRFTRSRPIPKSDANHRARPFTIAMPIPGLEPSAKSNAHHRARASPNSTKPMQIATYRPTLVIFGQNGRHTPDTHPNLEHDPRKHQQPKFASMWCPPSVAGAIDAHCRPQFICLRPFGPVYGLRRRPPWLDVRCSHWVFWVLSLGFLLGILVDSAGASAPHGLYRWSALVHSAPIVHCVAVPHAQSLGLGYRAPRRPRFSP